MQSLALDEAHRHQQVSAGGGEARAGLGHGHPRAVQDREATPLALRGRQPQAGQGAVAQRPPAVRDTKMFHEQRLGARRLEPHQPPAAVVGDEAPRQATREPLAQRARRLLAHAATRR
jgi:hypothetical protein